METRIKVNGDKNITHKTIKGKLGLTNKKNHTTFYLEGGTFLTPEYDVENFADVMTAIQNRCKHYIKNRFLKQETFEQYVKIPPLKKSILYWELYK